MNSISSNCMQIWTIIYLMRFAWCTCKWRLMKSLMNEFLCISYIFINYVDLLKHFINIDLHLQNIDALLKLHLQQSESATSQKSSWFSHEKMKSIVATENSKFSASRTQFKNDATFKFNKFKQDVASFHLHMLIMQENKTQD